jgi:hypothetical protein
MIERSERSYNMLTSDEKDKFLFQTVGKFMFESGQVCDPAIIGQTVESLKEYLAFPQFKHFTLNDIYRAFIDGTAAAVEFMESRITVLNVRKWLLKRRVVVMEKQDKELKAQQFTRMINEPLKANENNIFAEAVAWRFRMRENKTLSKTELDTLELDEMVKAIQQGTQKELIEVAKKRAQNLKIA